MCSEPRESNPARIHFCVIDAESVDVQAEIAAVAQQVVAPLGLRGFTKMLREAEVAGEIRGRMRAMARGCLPEENPPALSPVVSQPDLLRAPLETRRREELLSAGLSRGARPS